MAIQSEEFEQLIAEALRAGPGSPLWHEAVQILREAGQEGEEYRMLCRAREDLAAGRDYRSVHGGPGFTRKLMDNIDHEQTSSGIPTASIVIMAAILLLAAIVAAGAWMIFAPAKPASSAGQLAGIYFVTPVISEDFKDSTLQDFTRAGVLPVSFNDGAKVDVQMRAGDKHVGGCLYSARTFAAQKPYVIESIVEVANAKTDLITQVFVTDKPVFAADTSLSSHELACTLEQATVRVVLPDGRSVGAADLALDAKHTCTFRIRFNGDAAVVEQNGKVLWSGASQLSADQPRTIGLRYITRGGDKTAGVTVKSLKVLEP